MKEFPLEWPEFKEIKNLLFESDKILIMEIFLDFQIGKSNSNFQERLKTQHRAIQTLHNKMLDLIDLLKESGQVPFIEYELLFKQLRSSVESAQDYLIGDPDNDENHSSLPKIRSGPKSYPEAIEFWIYFAIQSAKGDRKKLVTLLHFFKSGGAFDKWIGSLSDYQLGTFLTKTTDLNVEKIDPEDINNHLKRLRDYKKSISIKFEKKGIDQKQLDLLVSWLKI